MPSNKKPGGLQVIAENLSTEEIQGLKQMFANIDTDKSGTITYDELKTGLARLGSKLTEAEVQQLMEAVRIKILFKSIISRSSFIYIIHTNLGLFFFSTY